MKVAEECTTPAQYIRSLPAERRPAIEKLDKLIRKNAPKLEPHLCKGMLAYGRYHYKYASGREGDWCIIALAAQKNYISLYICATDEGEYLPEKYQARLGKVSVGRSCIRIKKIEDLDLAAAADVIKRAATLPGGSVAL
ncbi:hypothetical protein BH20VER1_BH20VER1_28590 [soil metagenome]